MEAFGFDIVQRSDYATKKRCSCSPLLAALVQAARSVVFLFDLKKIKSGGKFR